MIESNSLVTNAVGTFVSLSQQVKGFGALTSTASKAVRVDSSVFNSLMTSFAKSTCA